MIAVDTNILVYAHRREAGEHEQARAVVKHLSEGDRLWAIPWPCCYEFLSVVTNRRIWKNAATEPGKAWRQFQAWTASPTLEMLGETEGFAPILEGFVNRPRVRGGVVHDARIAALCVAHGIEVLLTRDRDFSLFPELRTENPLGGSAGGHNAVHER